MAVTEKRADPRKQFSKKLARWTSVFWFVYMAWLSVLFLLVPEAAVYSVYMGIISTVVMMVNVAAYTANSMQEKVLLTMLDKTKIEFSLGPGKITAKANTDGGEETEEPAEEPEEEPAEETEDEGKEDG